jgi:hypothetical protein
MVTMADITNLVDQIRRDNQPQDGENLMDWFQRTYHQALLLIEHGRPELPMKRAQRERSNLRRRIAGEPNKKEETEE